jgi:phosphatidylinositol alpha-1,6-mannosyltransferase
VIVNSRFTAAAAIRHGAAPDLVRVVHPVVDASRFDCRRSGLEIRKRYRLDGRQVLLTVGRLVPRKGHDTVLRALPELLRQVPEAHYLVVGEGPERDKLEAYATELGLIDRVTFTGHVRDEALPSYYSAADLFVMVSRERPELGDIEGFGIVYLEASAAGRAVVAGRSGGVPDAVEDGISGILVEPDDPHRLAETLGRLLQDRNLRERLSRGGRKRVLERFNRGCCSATFREVADELAGDR